MEAQVEPCAAQFANPPQLIQTLTCGITVVQHAARFDGSVGLAVSAFYLRHLIETRPRPQARLDRNKIGACRIAELASNVGAIGIARTGANVGV